MIFFSSTGTEENPGYILHSHNFYEGFDLIPSYLFKTDFNQVVNGVINALNASGHQFDTTSASEGFARIFVFETGVYAKPETQNDLSTPIFHESG